MIPEFAYFLKVNMALVLLYAFYRLFFYKDTFFQVASYHLTGVLRSISDISVFGYSRLDSGNRSQ